jgi:hypothetical protein
MGFKTIDDGVHDSQGWTYRPNFRLLVPGMLIAMGSLIWIAIALLFLPVNRAGCQTAQCGGRVTVSSGVSGVIVAVIILAIFVGFLSGMFTFIRVIRGVLSAQRLLWRKFEIAVSTVSTIEPGYNGLTIRTESGRVYHSTTPQLPNIDVWRKKRGVSGEVIDRIISARDAAKKEAL